MADLNKEFDSEIDLSKSFDSEQDLSQPQSPISETPPSKSLLDYAKYLQELVFPGTSLTNTMVANPKEVAMGAHQGLTLSTADELRGLGTAIGDVGGDVLFGLPKKDLQGYLQTYRNAQQAAQKEYEQAQKAAPVAYGVGNLAGGAVTGGALSPIATASPILTGLAGGGVAGAGGSKETIEENPLGLAIDTGVGAGLGGGLGALSRMAGSVPATKPDLSTQSPFRAQLSKAAQLGEEGVKLSDTPAAREEIIRRLGGNVEELAGKLIGGKEKLGSAISTTLRQAGEEGQVLTIQPESAAVISDIQDSIVDNIQALGRKSANQIYQKLENFRQGLMGPEEAYLLRKELGNLSTKLPDPKFQAVMKNGVDEIKTVLEESVPDFAGKLGEYHKFLKAGPEALLGKGQASEVIGSLSDLNNPNLKISQEIESVIEGLRSGGPGELQKAKGFVKMIDELKSLQKTNPEILQKIGINPEALKQEFIDKADEAGVALKTAGVSLGEEAIKGGGFGIKRLLGGTALKGANLYGQLKGNVKGLFSAPNEELSGIVGQLKNSGNENFASMGNALEKAVGANDINKKNAVLFALLQQPKARELLGLSSTEEEK